MLPNSGDRLRRQILKCSVATNSRLCSMELSVCLQILSLQYGNSSSYWSVVFFWTLDSGKCLQTESLTNLIKIRSVIRCICKIVKSDYYLHHIYPLGMIQLPLGVFSWNLFFWKICWENERFKTRITVLYMKTNIHFLSYLAQFFLEWEMFQKKFVKKIKTHFICSKFSPKTSCHWWYNVENYSTAEQVTDNSMDRAHCLLDT